MSDSDWKTVPSPAIPLTFQAGGFVVLDLVAPIALGRPTLRGEPKFDGTQAVLEVAVPCHGLPPETPWKVEWLLPGHAEPVLGPPSTLAGGAVKATLDLATGGQALGEFLEAPGTLGLRLTPDYPHAHPHSVVLHVDFPHPFSLRVPGLFALSQASHATGLRVGQHLAVAHARKDWKACARLRVDTPGEQDAVLTFGASGGTAAWVLGMHGGSLQLPGEDHGQLAFNLVLEVSPDAQRGPWSPLATGVLTVPAPRLEALAVDIDPGAQRIIDAEDPTTWVSSGLWGEQGVRASGRFSGLAEGFDPPFTVELWAARPTAPGPNAPVVVQPLVDRPIGIDALRGGAFSLELDTIVTDIDALAYRGASPFVILRAGAGDPPPPLCVAFDPAQFLAFSDQDVWRKGDILGACSGGVTNGMNLTRKPVLGAVSVAVEKDALALYCSFLGPVEVWKDTKARFVLEAGSARIQKDASPLEVPNSRKGRFRAEIPFSKLGPFVGAKATLRLELGAPQKVFAPPDSGILRDLAIAPSIGPVEWTEDDAGHLHFLCRTTFIPKLSQVLVATLRAGVPPELTKPVTYAEKAGKVGGKVGELGLEFFPAPEDEARCKGLLSMGMLVVDVRLPPPGTHLDAGAAWVVAASESTPIAGRAP